MNGGAVEAAEVGTAQPNGQPAPYKYVHSEMERERCGLRLTREEVEAYKGRFPHINERDISAAVDSACYLARPVAAGEDWRRSSVEKSLAYRNRELAEMERREVEAQRRKAMEKPTDIVLEYGALKISRQALADMGRAFKHLPNLESEIYSRADWANSRADALGALKAALNKADREAALEAIEAADHSDLSW
jgi:hypothetical protein